MHTSNKLYLINTVATIPTTTMMMMMTMTKIATITTKMVGRLPLVGGDSVCSWVAAPVEGNVGLVMGGCVTTAPVTESKVLLGHC